MDPAIPTPSPYGSSQPPRWWRQQDKCFRMVSLYDHNVHLESLTGLNAKIDNAVLLIHPLQYQAWVHYCENFANTAANMSVPISLLGYRYLFWPVASIFDVSAQFQYGNKRKLRLYWKRPAWATKVAVCRVYLTEMDPKDESQLCRLAIRPSTPNRDGLTVHDLRFVYPEFYIHTSTNTCVAE